MIRELVGMVKDELPKSIIVLGGPEVSYNALDVMKDNPEVDYIVSGEGELPFAMLVESICCGEKQLYKIFLASAGEHPTGLLYLIRTQPMLHPKVRTPKNIWSILTGKSPIWRRVEDALSVALSAFRVRPVVHGFFQ